MLRALGLGLVLIEEGRISEVVNYQVQVAIIVKIGYGRAMVFAFIGHVISAVITITAKNYEMLYLGTFIYALANGIVEAVINPVVATVYDKNKTHWRQR